MFCFISDQNLFSYQDKMDLSKLTLYPEKNVKLPLYGIIKLPDNYEKVSKDKDIQFVLYKKNLNSFFKG